MHLYIIRNFDNIKNIYKSCQGTTTSQGARFSKFRLSEDTTVYWKSKSSSHFTRNKSSELVLEHNTKALSTLLLDFLILLCSLFTEESSELVDMRYDSQNTLERFRYKCFKCLFLAMIFLAQFIRMTFLLLP